MKQRIEMTAEPRTPGKHFSRALRVERKVPAVIYGGTENFNLWIDERDIVKYNTRAFENALFNLKSSEAKVNGKVVLMKDVTVHPVTRRPEHVDLFALDLTKPVRVNVEVRVEGKAAGIADGGLLNIVTRTVEVECLPNEIPEFFKIDVSNLGVGEAMHVSDLEVPSSFKMITGPEQTIAVCSIEEEQATSAPTTGAPAAAAPAAATGTPTPAKK